MIHLSTWCREGLFHTIIILTVVGLSKVANFTECEVCQSCSHHISKFCRASDWRNSTRKHRMDFTSYHNAQCIHPLTWMGGISDHHEVKISCSTIAKDFEGDAHPALT